MCVLDCAPSALKLLHSSAEFMPFVIFIAAPGMDQLKQLYAERRAAGGSQRNLTVSDSKLCIEQCAKCYVANNLNANVVCYFVTISFVLTCCLQFDRQSSIRYSSRRARTLESLASLYEVSCYC